MAGDVLAVGGIDPTGGAGVTADLLALALTGARGRAVVAVITSQGGGRAARTWPVPGPALAGQLEAAASDRVPDVVKAGALGGAPQVEALASFLEGSPGIPLVLDPVIEATAGGRLLDDAGVAALKARLLPLARVMVPNLAEAAALAGTGAEARDRDGMEEAASRLLGLGPEWVLLKGGHLPGDPADLLAGRSGERAWIRGRRVMVARTHGTGCAHASAIASAIAAGLPVEAACRDARAFVEWALEASPPGGTAPDLAGILVAGGALAARPAS